MRTGPAGQDEPRIGDLSEGEILRRILARLSPAAAASLGPGDDAAVLDAGAATVATTDTLVHGPDFRLAWSAPADLGWKAAAVNLADVAAMGATPTALLVALAIPDDLPVSFAEGLAEGLDEACRALAPGCGVVGGDLTVSPTLTIAVTALGRLDGPAVTRSGARPGDVLALAGRAGAAARGLELLFGRFRDAEGAPVPVRAEELDERERDDLRAQLRPVPPVSLGAGAARAGARAMMDVSDGLALDATRMASASAVTIRLDRSALDREGLHALEGGEDHALLAAFPEGVALPAGFRPIGAVVEERGTPLLVDEEPYRGRGGWDPYRDWDAVSG